MQFCWLVIVAVFIPWDRTVSAFRISPEDGANSVTGKGTAVVDTTLWEQFLTSLRNGSKPLGKNGNQQIILMFGNYDYRFVMVNAMERFHMFGVTNYAVVCLDNRLANLMRDVGRPCEIMPASNKADIWQVRLRMLSDLLAGGTDVLMTDADAVWRRNPIHILRDNFKDADVFASRGNFPNQVGEKIGATACMGFVYFAANPAVSHFVQHEVVPIFNGDDQRALNAAMLINGIDCHRKLGYVSSTSIDTCIIPAKGDRSEFKVSMLDHHRFQRKCDFPLGDDVYVAHCLSSKDGASKHEMLLDNNLVYIKDSWESNETARNFTEWIENVKKTTNMSTHS